MQENLGCGHKRFQPTSDFPYSARVAMPLSSPFSGATLRPFCYPAPHQTLTFDIHHPSPLRSRGFLRNDDDGERHRTQNLDPFPSVTPTQPRSVNSANLFLPGGRPATHFFPVLRVQRPPFRRMILDDNDDGVIEEDWGCGRGRNNEDSAHTLITSVLSFSSR